MSGLPVVGRLNRGLERRARAGPLKRVCNIPPDLAPLAPMMRNSPSRPGNEKERCQTPIRGVRRSEDHAMQPTIPHQGPPDTSPDSLAASVSALRRLGIAGRAAMTFELGNALRARVEAGVRRCHPDDDDELVRVATARLWLGRKFGPLVCPGLEIDP